MMAELAEKHKHAANNDPKCQELGWDIRLCATGNCGKEDSWQSGFTAHAASSESKFVADVYFEALS